MDRAIHRASLPAKACGLILWLPEGHPTLWSGKRDGSHVETGNDSKS